MGSRVIIIKYTGPTSWMFLCSSTAAFYPQKPHSTPIPFCRTSLPHSANPGQLRSLVFKERPGVNILQLWPCWEKDRSWSPSQCRMHHLPEEFRMEEQLLIMFHDPHHFIDSIYRKKTKNKSDVWIAYEHKYEMQYMFVSSGCFGLSRR